MSEIIGVLFAIFVGTLLIPKFAGFQQVSNDNMRASTTAQQQKQLTAAGTTYIQQNSVAIQALATSTSPVIITVPMLQAAAVNLLPASFSATNPYGQTWQVQVLQPTAGNLQALSLSINGSTIADAQAGKIAAIVGASGGLIPLNDSGIFTGGSSNAYGAYAGWTVSTANYSSISGGHPAALITFNNGQLANNYLYRSAVPGQPQLNQMSTNLDMNGNRVNNASQLNTALLTATGNAVVGSLNTAGVVTAGKAQLNDVVVAGATCAPNGLVSRDSTGLLLSCQSGAWAKQGGGTKAQVNFDGTNCPGGWCAVRSQTNVSGVWRNGLGDYTVYFSSPFPDANFVANITVGNGGGPAMMTAITSTATNAVRFTTMYGPGAGQGINFWWADLPFVMAAIN